MSAAPSAPFLLPLPLDRVTALALDDGARVQVHGRVATGCSAAGVPSPCLLPRLPQIAHERLLTVREFAPTLSGGIELEAGGDGPPAAVSKLTIAGLCIAGALTIAWLAVAWSRRVARTALGRVRAAARQALRATEGDATLEPVRKEIRVLVDRAVGLDSVELERIESVLRVVTLRAGAPRGLSTLPCPVDALVAELDLRDQAMAEVDAR